MREAVDFWEGPESTKEEVSATEERVDCWRWRWEEDEARIIRSAVGPSIQLATKLNSQSTDVHSLPATTTTLPLPLLLRALWR
jgi:hypothetical protein